LRRFAVGWPESKNTDMPVLIPRACGHVFTFSLMLSLDFDIHLIDEGMPQRPMFNRKAWTGSQGRDWSTQQISSFPPSDTLERFARSAVSSTGRSVDHV
jgi:hypothetical protein